MTVAPYEFKAGIGRTVFCTENGIKITVNIEKEDDTSLASKPFCDSFPDMSKIGYALESVKVLSFAFGDGLLFRNRRAGDRLEFGSISKSVRRVMSEGKVPEDMRDIIPCAVDGEGVAWVPFLSCAKRCERGEELWRVSVRIERN